MSASTEYAAFMLLEGLMVKRGLIGSAVALILTITLQPTVPSAHQPQSTQVIAARTAPVDGLDVHYLIAGRGPTVVLLHGYAQTSRMWRPLMPRLATNFTVIAPDLPGIGDSAIPANGLDMTHAASRIHVLIAHLGLGKAAVVGHDIGLMVAYAYAAQFPSDVEKLVLMDAFLPGVAGWEAIYNHPAIWHFRFNGPTPEALVRGRERTYFEHFWNDFAADKSRSIPEADRQAYAAAYARPGRMRAAWAYFVSFQQAAKDFTQFSKTKLTMPVLSIGGEKANGDALGQQVKIVALNAKAVTLPNTGHWVMEENPQGTMDALVSFLGSQTTTVSSPSPSSGSGEGTSTLAQMRLTPEEVRASQTGTEQIGSSLLMGVSTKILSGDPSKAGFYSIVLSVPPNTTIQAHSHRDDRLATVVSGTWQFGYGDRFDEQALKRLPPGSVYSEPGGTNHFARTGAEPVLVQITGVGPTDTRYVNPTDAPKGSDRR
jgi:pimeloyl-ACP methyl ester carboxylesterase/quercetin dioxygenase-like cupin family protein